MKPRSILGLSVLTNIALALALTALWSQRNAGREVQTVAPSRDVDPGVRSQANPAVGASMPQPVHPQSFHWSQVESRDYREYIANLRALGCPERLIRDMLLAELGEFYSASRDTVQRELLPPWAGSDSRQAVHEAHQRQLRFLAQERRVVTEQLLGFPWSAQARMSLRILLCYGWSGAAIGTLNGLPGEAVFLGHQTTEQSLQVLTLAEIYRDRASEVTERAQGILLPEDRAELGALAGELNFKISTVLTAAESEELNLRIHWLGVADLRHLNLADLNGSELRQIVRLHALSTVPPRVMRLASERSVEGGPTQRPPVVEQNAAHWQWSDLASADFIAYRENLRAVGCPEKTVRDILESELDHWFFERSQPIADGLQYRFWDLAAQRGSDAFYEIEGQLRQLWEEREKLSASILDDRTPEINRFPPREAFARQYYWLPADLQSQLVDLDAQYTQRLGLDDNAANRAWDIQRDAQAAIQQLRAIPGLDVRGRQVALDQIIAEAASALQHTLGNPGSATYQQYAGEWLQTPQP